MTSQTDKGTCVEIILPVRSELVEAQKNGEVSSGESEEAEDDGNDATSAGRA